jgi:hypothetical protein
VHFGLPPGPAAGAAPAWLFIVLLVAPAAVAATVWRRLERMRPASEQDALAAGGATAAGFAGAAWLFALVGRISLLAAIAPPGRRQSALFLLRGRGSGVGTFVGAQPNPVTVLVLALMWALAGGLGAAFVWAIRHQTRWQISGGAPASLSDGNVNQEPGVGADPPEEKP